LLANVHVFWLAFEIVNNIQSEGFATLKNRRTPGRESEKNRESGPESEKNRESCPESEKNRESGPKSEKNRESGPESEGNQESGFKIRRKARYRFLKMEKNKVSIFKNEEKQGIDF
jgi:hypothetical protein